jgi:uncharacterized circularly permuted ATP-grasp superfamily protein/uncharacterized alpha-E superfamily protein
MTGDGSGKSATAGWWSRLSGWYTDSSSRVASAEPGACPELVPWSNEQVSTGMAALAQKPASAPLSAGYPVSDIFDEMVGRDGAIAPHWQALLAGLERLSHQQRLERVDRINTRVRETGIAHDLFADPSRTLQPWRLDLVPLVFPPSTWATIEAAIIQRARLLELVLGDIYGPQQTLSRGLIPPELVFNDPAYLRACQNINPTAGRIQFFAADLARGPDGNWRVVDTHVETPAGIGYALANRTVITHVSGDMFRDCKAVRLAPFFQQMQDALAHRIGRSDPAIALLTPGPHHNDFFSHAYLARYLGFQLVEGADLRAESGSVYLKTLDGLHPIDLIVRCVAGGSSDALELDPAGFLGPVGLVQSVRQKPDLVANALGTAVAENRGLGSYLPELCKQLLGEDLAIWDVAKWWLGDAAVRQAVIGDLDRYFIRRAFEQTARPGRAAPARDPARLTPAERSALIAEIQLDGAAMVAEEKTALGTTPSYGQNGLEPKPFAVRIFATAIPGAGFAVMPGGLAMTVDPGASMALMAPDGASRDVWVISDAPQPAFKSLWRPALDKAQIQRSPRELPSRAADNLFWLGRYTEQADWTFRVLRTCLSRIEEDSGPRQNLRLVHAVLANRLERDGSPPVPVPSGLDETQAIAHLARLLMTATARVHSLPQTLGHVHRIAGLTRDRLSLEAWRTLNAFYVGPHWQSGAVPVSIGESLDLIDAGLAALSAFNGLTHENMTRNFGWSFLDMGRRMARAQNLSQLLQTAFCTGRPDDDDNASLLFVLELADSFITYRSRYRLNPMLALILDLLIIDEGNPRSIAFQLAALSTHIDALPQTGNGGGRTEAQRTALSMLSAVRLADPMRLAAAAPDDQQAGLAALLSRLLTGIPHLSDAITRRYFSMVEKEPKWMRARTRQEP